MRSGNAKMISRGGGPAVVDRRLLMMSVIMPVLLIVPALLERLGSLKWIGLGVVLPLLLLSAAVFCLVTILWLRRTVRIAIRAGGMCCGACAHVLRGYRGPVCPECGAARPSDTLLRCAWWRWAPLFHPCRYRRGTYRGALRRRLVARMAKGG